MPPWSRRWQRRGRPPSSRSSRASSCLCPFWEKQGFCTEVVKKCPKEEKPESSAISTVFPVKSISWTETVEKVRQTLLEHERQATAKRQAKSKSKAAQEDLDLPAPAPSNKEDKTQEQKTRSWPRKQRSLAEERQAQRPGRQVPRCAHHSAHLFREALEQVYWRQGLFSSLLFSTLLLSLSLSVSLSLSLPSFRVTGLGLDPKASTYTHNKLKKSNFRF